EITSVDPVETTSDVPADTTSAVYASISSEALIEIADVLSPEPRRGRGRTISGTFVLLTASVTLLTSYLVVRTAELPVVIPPPPPAPPLAPTPPSPPPPAPVDTPLPGTTTGSTPLVTNIPGQVVIQVAAFSAATRADTLRKQLLSEGYQARTVTVDAGPRLGHLMQVVIGYPTVDNAQSDLVRVRERFPDARLLAR